MRISLLIILIIISCKFEPSTVSSTDNFTLPDYDQISEVQSATDQELAAKFEELKSRLLSRLRNALKEGGPEHAIGVCRIASPEIEKSLSNGAQILRVSDRPRNPDHRATPVESMVLDLWVARLKENKPIGPVVFDSPEGRIVMSPIQIAGQMCLQCHGAADQLSSGVKQALAKEYPNDEATGYSLKELRGAVVARVPN